MDSTSFTLHSPPYEPRPPASTTSDGRRAHHPLHRVRFMPCLLSVLSDLNLISPFNRRNKGISSSVLPYKRKPSRWLKISTMEVEDYICKFTKKGLAPSQIGVILRDSHDITHVKSVTGSKIFRILNAHCLAPEISEDTYHPMKKVVVIWKHLDWNMKDNDSKLRLILVERRIHRLDHYYRRTKKLAPLWKSQVDMNYELLEHERILDYSLLAGVHFREITSPTNASLIDDTTIFSPDNEDVEATPRLSRVDMDKFLCDPTMRPLICHLNCGSYRVGY